MVVRGGPPYGVDMQATVGNASRVKRFEERSPRYQRRANKVELVLGGCMLVIGALFALAVAGGVIAAVIRLLR